MGSWRRKEMHSKGGCPASALVTSLLQIPYNSYENNFLQPVSEKPGRFSGVQRVPATQQSSTSMRHLTWTTIGGTTPVCLVLSNRQLLPLQAVKIHISAAQFYQKISGRIVHKPSLRPLLPCFSPSGDGSYEWQIKTCRLDLRKLSLLYLDVVASASRV